MQIDTVIYFQITDPKLYTYGVERPMNAIENLTATTLRNIIGEMELDQSLTSRDTINAKMRAILDEATDPWGIKVNRVELKNIIPPKEIQNAMEKQMKAERERRGVHPPGGGAEAVPDPGSGGREAVPDSQGGCRQAGRHPEGRGREGGPHHGRRGGRPRPSCRCRPPWRTPLKLLNAAAPNDQVVKLKALEAMQKVADGKATKIIIPSELQGLAGLAASAKTVFDTEDPKGSEGKAVQAHSKSCAPVFCKLGRGRSPSCPLPGRWGAGAGRAYSHDPIQTRAVRGFGRDLLRPGGSGAVCVPLNCPRRSGVLPCLRGEVRPMRGAPRKPGLGHSDYSDFYPLTAG